MKGHRVTNHYVVIDCSISPYTCEIVEVLQNFDTSRLNLDLGENGVIKPNLYKTQNIGKEKKGEFENKHLRVRKSTFYVFIHHRKNIQLEDYIGDELTVAPYNNLASVCLDDVNYGGT